MRARKVDVRAYQVPRVRSPTIRDVGRGRGGCNQKFGDTIDRELEGLHYVLVLEANQTEVIVADPTRGAKRCARRVDLRGR